MESYPRILFHGTNGKYEQEQRAKHGAYFHDSFGAVQLTQSLQWATDKAIGSMYDYQAFGRENGAIVLIIDTQRLVATVQDFQYPEGVVPAELKWLIQELNPDAYKIISVINGLNNQARMAIENIMKGM